MEVATASGASVRTAYKTVRTRLRIEARRQKELDGGVEPEVVLDSFLNHVKVEKHPQSGPLKRVLTPAPKLPNIVVRGTRSCKRLCVGGSPTTRCVPTAIGATAGMRWLRRKSKRWVGLVRRGPVQQQNKATVGPACYRVSETKKHPKGSARDSWNNSWDRYDYRDKWTDVWKSDHDGTGTHVWNDHYRTILSSNMHDPLITPFAEATMTPPLSRRLRLIQVSHLLTQLHRVESSSVRFERPKRLSSTSLDSNLVLSLATTKQWALEAKPRCWERWRCPPVWEASMA